MTQMELKTKRNRLTRYGLACGYIEKATNGIKTATLLMEGSHVRIDVYDKSTGKRSSMPGSPNMKEARYRFQYLIKKYHLIRILS